jgi:hypothetical protein
MVMWCLVRGEGGGECDVAFDVVLDEVGFRVWTEVPLEKFGNNVKVFCFCNRDVRPKLSYREGGSGWCAPRIVLVVPFYEMRSFRWVIDRQLH